MIFHQLISLINNNESRNFGVISYNYNLKTRKNPSGYSGYTHALTNFKLELTF